MPLLAPRRIAAGLVLLAAVACAPRPTPRLAPASADSARFEQVIGRYLEGPRERRSRRGDETRDFLAGLEAAAATRAAERAAGQLVELHAIDTTLLSGPQRIDWLLLESYLQRTVIDTVLHQAERIPGRYLTLGDIYWRVAGDRPPRPGDWADIRRDLLRAPLAMDLGRRQLREPPPLWVRLAVSTAHSYSTFLAGEFPARVRATAPDTLRDSLLAAGDRARAALEGYAAFLQDTLQPGAESSWMAGRDYYDWILAHTNFLGFGADSMVALGRSLHAQTRRALDSLAAAIRPGTPWRVLADEMRERHPEAGHVAEAYRRASHQVRALLIRDDLVAIPPCEELIFVPTPPQLRETYAWGGYGGIAVRDSVMVGRFFVTDVAPSMTPEQAREKLRTQNEGWITVIALHEGYPGHHLQTVYARRNPRRLRRQGGNSYYGEGWALFAEHWMGRAGLYEDDDARLAQLQMRLWRTARVIIDPSLHTGAMTYEQAVRFFVDEVGLERSAAEAEVNRFTTWPTQAPSYIVGWRAIEDLEQEIRNALGARFSEKRFVEQVLEAGPLPPALLRRAVREANGLAN